MSRTPLALKILSVFLLLTSPGSRAAEAVTSPRERTSFNDNWLFLQGDPSGATEELSYTNKPPRDFTFAQTAFDDREWRRLNLPHDWAIEGPVKQEYAGETAKLKYWGPVWYRKHFQIPASDAAKNIFLDLDGAMSGSEVWLNGHPLGGWPYGYTSFELNLSPFIQFGGENVLAIRLDTPPDASRWYPGGGIYRNVWLVKTAPLHVVYSGTCVTTPKVKTSAADVQIMVNVANETMKPTTASVKNEIFKLNLNGSRGKLVATSDATGLSLTAHLTNSVTTHITINRPELWSVSQPNRYVAIISIEQDGKVVDRYETPFGIRTMEFTVTNGFLLNGQRLPIHGVCLHDDLGPLGMALNTRARERQLELLKTIGCNAIRTTHNPPSPELLDLCDRMGFVVMAEAFDAWAEAKRPGDYHLFFPEWHERDLRAFIRRDRNHPSIIMWSIGNEVYEQHDADGWKLGKQLADLVQQEDSTRPVTMALHTVESSTNGFQNVVDVFGYNYKPTEYAAFRKNNPNLPLIGSETSSCVSSRGEYFFPVSNDKKSGRADFQTSSYDVAAPSWAYMPDVEFKGQDQNPFVAGEFVWTGFDYLGEPTPYDHDTTNRLLFTNPAVQSKWDDVLKRGGKIEVPSRASYFGIFDLCGFKKDRAFLYQSRWQSNVPMAHLMPQNWNWPERVGQITPVQVYTSGDAAELFLNGKSLGVKHKGPFEYRLRWDDVIYQPGTLKVVATRNGKKWAADTVKTIGPATKLELKADRTSIRADGQDLSFITLTIEDKNGLMVPNASNQIRFHIKGPGEIIATGNGDATSHDSFQSPEPKAFNGLCLAIVRAQAGETGKIIIEAEADGLTLASITIKAVHTK
ncbi:MAG TPA: beta-galactosidase GalB [Verrucomicrobiae bacterium]|nr:beta-galactosidase GalB [Verrucomicrobiae bacterium]